MLQGRLFGYVLFVKKDHVHFERVELSIDGTLAAYCVIISPVEMQLGEFVHTLQWTALDCRLLIGRNRNHGYKRNGTHHLR